MLMLVFNYLLKVYKYFAIAYNNHTVKYALSLIIAVHILGLHDCGMIRKSNNTHV